MKWQNCEWLAVKENWSTDYTDIMTSIQPNIFLFSPKYFHQKKSIFVVTLIKIFYFCE